MKYIYTELYKFEKDKNSKWDNLHLYYEYYKYMFLFDLVKVYFVFTNYFNRTEEEIAEGKDAEKVFEFHH